MIVGAPHSGKIRLVNALTGSPLQEVKQASHAGIIVPFTVDTKYYAADIRFLIDEFPALRAATSSITDLSSWVLEFTSDECIELHQALDGVLFCVNVQKGAEYILQMLDAFLPVKDVFDDQDRQVFFAVVGNRLPNEADPLVTIKNLVDISNKLNTIDDRDIEDAVILCGLEWINMQATGLNEFNDSVGAQRVIELLETHPWEGLQLKLSQTDENALDPRDRSSSNLENTVEKARQMSVGLLEDTDHDNPSTCDLDRVLQKLKIAKSSAQDMSDTEREMYAKKMIGEVMDLL